MFLTVLSIALLAWFFWEWKSNKSQWLRLSLELKELDAELAIQQEEGPGQPFSYRVSEEIWEKSREDMLFYRRLFWIELALVATDLYFRFW